MRSIVVLVVVVSGLVGCGKSNPPEQASPAKASPAAAKTPDHPAAHVAHRLMTAIVKGDVEAANKLITPKALQRFQATNQTFVAADGDGSATFTIDDVRQVNDDEAMVQCVTTSGPNRAEMCWVVCRTEGIWQVRGLIGGPSADEAMVYDFEGDSPMTPRPLGAGAPAAAPSRPPQSAMAPAGNPVQ